GHPPQIGRDDARRAVDQPSAKRDYARDVLGTRPATEATPMHRLHLLRHAKSDRDAELEDHERPLARRGREAARRVGESLPAAIGALDLVLCSPSLRTRETAALVLARFAPRPSIQFED